MFQARTRRSSGSISQSLVQNVVSTDSERNNRKVEDAPNQRHGDEPSALVVSSCYL